MAELARREKMGLVTWSLTFICLMVGHTHAASHRICPTDFTLVGASCYLLDRVARNRNDAEVHCQSKSVFAHLVSFERARLPRINRPGEQDEAQKYIQREISDNISSAAHWTSGETRVDDPRRKWKYIWTHPKISKVKNGIWPGTGNNRAPSLVNANQCLYMDIERGGAKYDLKQDLCSQPKYAMCEIDMCNDCQFANGIYYSNKVEVCDCYVSCASRFAVANKTCCGEGLFWHPIARTCQIPDLVNCVVDPCQSGGILSHPVSGNCRLYYTCDGGRTGGVRSCCGDDGLNRRYDEMTRACVEETEGEACIPSCVQPTITPAPGLVCSRNPSTNTGYNQCSDPCTSIPTFIPCKKIGTVYIVDGACSCDFPGCVPDFAVLFETYKSCDQQNEAAIVGNVHGLDGRGQFKGELSNFVVPRYSNFDFRKTFALEIVFNDQNKTNSDAALFSNSDCEDEASILISINNIGVSPTLTIQLINTDDGTVSFAFNYQSGVDTAVIAQYDGKTFTAGVSGPPAESQTYDQFRGTIRVPVCSTVHLGFAWEDKYYDGEITQARIYLCTRTNVLDGLTKLVDN